MIRDFKSTIQNNIYIIRYLFVNCKFYCFFSIAITVYSAFYSFISIQLNRFLINQIVSGSSLSVILRILLVQCLLGIVYSYSDSYYSIILSPISVETIHANMQMGIFERIRKQRLSAFNETAFFDKINIAMHNADSRALTSFSTCLRLLKSIIETILISGLILTLNSYLLIIIVVQMIILLTLELLRRRISYEFEMETVQPKRGRAYISRTYYLRDNIKDVLSSHIFEVLNDKYMSITERIKSIIKQYANKLLRLSFSQSTIQHVASLSISAILVKQVLSEKLLFGDFIAGINSATKVTASISLFFEEIPKLYENSLYISHYRDFVEKSEAIAPQYQHNKSTPEDSLLYIDNISYSYNTDIKKKKAVDSLSLSINRGINALVGENGAGKSTVAALLSGILLPDNGCISLIQDGNIIYSWEENWKDYICAIYQDSKLFAATIAENVLMHRKTNELDKEVVVDALKKANIWSKVSCLPDGIDTPISSEFDDGSIFSGGESQKIILARLFASKAPIVILDEAFVSIDGINEEIIWQNVKERLINRFAFILTHNYIHNHEMSQIIILRNGSLVAKGNHQSLLNNEYYMWLLRKGKERSQNEGQ